MKSMPQEQIPSNTLQGVSLHELQIIDSDGDVSTATVGTCMILRA